jgi:hypothetical protein
MIEEKTKEQQKERCKEWEGMFPFSECKAYSGEYCPKICNYAIRVGKLEIATFGENPNRIGTNAIGMLKHL